MNRELIKQIRKIHTEHNPHIAPHDRIFNIDNDHIYIVKYKSKTYALMNPRVIDDELIVDWIRGLAI